MRMDKPIEVGDNLYMAIDSEGFPLAYVFASSEEEARKEITDYFEYQINRYWKRNKGIAKDYMGSLNDWREHGEPVRIVDDL